MFKKQTKAFSNSTAEISNIFKPFKDRHGKGIWGAFIVSNLTLANFGRKSIINQNMQKANKGSWIWYNLQV